MCEETPKTKEKVLSDKDKEYLENLEADCE